MTKPKIYIYGSGGFAREVAMIIDENGNYDEFGGFVDLTTTVQKLTDTTIMGRPVIKEEEFLSLSNVKLIIGVGDPGIRKRIVDSLPSDIKYASIVHHTASVSRWAILGEGSVVCAGCIITVNVELGAHTQLNLNTTIGHDVKAEDFFTTAPSVNISGECIIGEAVYFGTGSATRQGLSIASRSTIGMGAMLVKSALNSGVYVGIPAKLHAK